LTLTFSLIDVLDRVRLVVVSKDRRKLRSISSVWCTHENAELQLWFPSRPAGT